MDAGPAAQLGARAGVAWFAQRARHHISAGIMGRRPCSVSRVVRGGLADGQPPAFISWENLSREF